MLYKAFSAVRYLSVSLTWNKQWNFPDSVTLSVNRAPVCFLSSCYIIDISRGAFWGIGVYWSVSLGWWISSLNHYFEGQCTAICSVQPILLYCPENWGCSLLSLSLRRPDSFMPGIICSPGCIQFYKDINIMLSQMKILRFWANG